MKNTFFIVFICFIAIMIACKTQKENQTTSGQENSSTTSTEDKQAHSNEKPASSPGQEQAIDVSKLKKMEFVSAKDNDTIFATIERTPCYGTCPVYKLMIFKSGIALYEGKQNVEKIGRYIVEFSEEEIKTIREKAIEINYFKLQDEYDSPVTDFPTTLTSIRINGKVKSVSNRVGGPEELKSFEKHLHETLMQKDFLNISE